MGGDEKKSIGLCNCAVLLIIVVVDYVKLISYCWVYIPPIPFEIVCAETTILEVKLKALCKIYVRCIL